MYCVFIFRHIYIRNYFIFWYTDTLSLLSVLFIVLFLVRGSISSITTRKPPPDFSRLSSGWSKASVLALRVFSCQGFVCPGHMFCSALSRLAPRGLSLERICVRAAAAVLGFRAGSPSFPFSAPVSNSGLPSCLPGLTACHWHIASLHFQLSR